MRSRCACTPKTRRAISCRPPACCNRVQWPTDGVRVETAVEAGSVITPHYDPMMAKLIVHGHDRADALARMRAALATTRVVGVAHNLAFLQALLRDAEVTQGTP